MEEKQGLLLQGIGGFYYVEAEGTVYECKARGVFRKKKQKPLAGDHVTLLLEDGTATITELLPRKNSLIRPPLANMDQLFLVSSVRDPSPNLLVLDKMIAVAEDKNIEPVVIFSKTDLGDAAPLVDLYRRVGLPVIAVSQTSPDGIEEIRSRLKGKVSAFAGNTGVGKSTLLNRISTAFQRETGEISQKLGRGRHTTRSAELLKLDCGGYVADTPGFSTVDIERYDMVKKDDLQYAFREFSPYLGTCKFQSCAHIGEKGCAVCAAVERGEIAKSRHDSYVSMYNEVKDIKEWQRK
ncbi:MAG: ribosome small subunit-dependent GTPase A [Oscillospiraceae bacterium]|nr:ribosome small subunit-dependent GTPase A [Oscillospiraceae bacterium]